MRTTFALLSLLPLFVSAAAAPSFAKQINVSVTQDQVNTVCGKKLASNGPYSGCTVACAGGNLCDFSCKGSKCHGTVVTIDLKAPPRQRPPMVATSNAGLATTFSNPSSPAGSQVVVGVPIVY